VQLVLPFARIAAAHCSEETVTGATSESVTVWVELPVDAVTVAVWSTENVSVAMVKLY